MALQTEVPTSPPAYQFVNTVSGSPRKSENAHQGINPATGQPLWDVPIATRADLEEAVTKGNEAFRSWSKAPWEARQQAIAAMSKILTQNRAEMIEILSLECGKPVRL